MVTQTIIHRYHSCRGRVFGTGDLLLCEGSGRPWNGRWSSGMFWWWFPETKGKHVGNLWFLVLIPDSTNSLTPLRRKSAGSRDQTNRPVVCSPMKRLGMVSWYSTSDFRGWSLNQQKNGDGIFLWSGNHIRNSCFYTLEKRLDVLRKNGMSREFSESDPSSNSLGLSLPVDPAGCSNPSLSVWTLGSRNPKNDDGWRSHQTGRVISTQGFDHDF